MTITLEQNGTEIEVPKGEIFEVSFDENPTTGYRWQIVFCDTLEFLRDTYSSCSKAPGSGGKHAWVFRVHSDGVLKMEYKRSWENKSPLQKLFEIKVKAI